MLAREAFDGIRHQRLKRKLPPHRGHVSNLCPWQLPVCRRSDRWRAEGQTHSIAAVPLAWISDTLTLMKWQLLHKACWLGDSEEVERLLKAGADPNQIAPTDWRQSPLGRTLEFRITSPRHAGRVETVRILLQYGADPTPRSTCLDMAPLQIATFCGLEPAVRLLRDCAATTAHPSGMTSVACLRIAASSIDRTRIRERRTREYAERELGLAEGDAAHDGGWSCRSLRSLRPAFKCRR